MHTITTALLQIVEILQCSCFREGRQTFLIISKRMHNTIAEKVVRGLTLNDIHRII